MAASADPSQSVHTGEVWAAKMDALGREIQEFAATRLRVDLGIVSESV